MLLSKSLAPPYVVQIYICKRYGRFIGVRQAKTLVVIIAKF
jgi:hypothetical protein